MGERPHVEPSRKATSVSAAVVEPDEVAARVDQPHQELPGLAALASHLDRDLEEVDLRLVARAVHQRHVDLGAPSRPSRTSRTSVSFRPRSPPRAAGGAASSPISRCFAVVRPDHSSSSACEARLRPVRGPASAAVPLGPAPARAASGSAARCCGIRISRAPAGLRPSTSTLCRTRARLPLGSIPSRVLRRPRRKRAGTRQWITIRSLIRSLSGADFTGDHRHRRRGASRVPGSGSSRPRWSSNRRVGRVEIEPAHVTDTCR